MNQQVDLLRLSDFEVLAYHSFGGNHHSVYLKSYWGNLYSFTVNPVSDGINSIIMVLNYFVMLISLGCRLSQQIKLFTKLAITN